MYFRKIVISRTEAGQNKESLGRGPTQWTMGALPTLYFDRLTKASRPIGKPLAFPPTLRTQDKYMGIGENKAGEVTIVSCSPYMFSKALRVTRSLHGGASGKDICSESGPRPPLPPISCLPFKAWGWFHLHITRIRPKSGLESFFSSSKSQPFKGKISLKVAMKRTESDISLQ